MTQRKSKPGYENEYWCCGADFGKHEKDCPNLGEGKPDSEAKPKCDKCGCTGRIAIPNFWGAPYPAKSGVDGATIKECSCVAVERVQPEPAKPERKIFLHNEVSQPGKCHGCLDGITLKFREELNEWWHFPEGLGAYRCVRIVGCPEHGTNCRVGIEIEKMKALGVVLKSVFHFADCPCFGDSVEHDEACGNCTCMATIEEEMRTELRAYGTQAQWLQAEAGRLWSYAAKQRRENYRLQEEIAHYKFALEGKQ